MKILGENAIPGVEIQTIEQLCEWLMRTKPKYLCVIAKESTGPQSHFMTINAEADFIPSLLGGSEYIMKVVDYLSGFGPTVVGNRSKRRARASRRR